MSKLCVQTGELIHGSNTAMVAGLSSHGSSAWGHGCQLSVDEDAIGVKNQPHAGKRGATVVDCCYIGEDRIP